MKDTFSLDHLSDTIFEEFCFDLIKEIGFKNVNWRKGTGLSSSPSDQGRDIEAIKQIKDIDGEIINEKWFFECKHYKNGVPPEKIQGAITWAIAERPDKLVIIASNFLSNPCKNWIENFINNTKPTFKIKTWELKELEELTYDKIRLKNNYSIISDNFLISELHPSHIKYCSKPYINKLDFFFELMDKFDPGIRKEIINIVIPFFIKPRFREPQNEYETIGELLLDPIDYKSFKTKCYNLRETLVESLIVKSIVNSCLEWAFNYGNKTRISEVIKTNEYIIEGIESNSNLDEKQKNKIIKDTRKRIQELPKKTEEAYERYIIFCEEIVNKLMNEEFLFK